MIKTFSSSDNMSYRYTKTGRFTVRTSDNVHEWIFSGNERNSLTGQLVAVNNLNENVSSLGAYCFKNCSRLTEVCLSGSGVMSIGANCFQNCASLRRVILPGTLNTIKENAFNGCTQLTSVTYPAFETDSAFNGVQSGIHISSSFLNNCGSLSRIVFPAGLSDETQLPADMLNGSCLSDITFIGLDPLDYIRQTYCLGLRRDAIVRFGDERTYSYRYSENTAPLLSTFSIPKSVASEGKLPVTSGGTVHYKMRFGKPYIFRQNLIEWCKTERVPFSIILFDHMTSLVSRDVFNSVISNQNFQKKIQKGDTRLNFYIFILDRAGRIETNDADLEYFRNTYATRHTFVSVISEYGGKTKTATTATTSPDDFYNILTSNASSLGFGGWDYSKYDVKWDSVDNETVPSGSVYDGLKTQLGCAPWWYGDYS